MVWPCRRRELLDVLEGEPRLSGRINENEPVPSCGVWLSRTWGLVTGPVLIAQELAVELRQPAGIGRVEDHRTQRREHLGHAVILPYARRERRPEVPAIRDGTPRQNCDLRDPWRRDRAPECAHRSTRPDRSFAGEQNAWRPGRDRPRDQRAARAPAPSVPAPESVRRYAKACSTVRQNYGRRRHDSRSRRGATNSRGAFACAFEHGAVGVFAGKGPAASQETGPPHPLRRVDRGLPDRQGSPPRTSRSGSAGATSSVQPEPPARSVAAPLCGDGLTRAPSGSTPERASIAGLSESERS